MEGHDTSWRESADGRHALAITHVAGGNQARWFERREDRWQPLGAGSARVGGGASCVRPDGTGALLLGRAPATIDVRGVQAAITDLRQAGTCAWAAEGGIVAALSRSGGGLRARLRTFDGSARVTWQLDTEGEVMVTADPLGACVAWTAHDVLHEQDPRSGKELRILPGVRSALYAADASLVVARSGETVEWLR